mgnify:FL=1
MKCTDRYSAKHAKHDWAPSREATDAGLLMRPRGVGWAVLAGVAMLACVSCARTDPHMSRTDQLSGHHATAPPQSETQAHFPGTREVVGLVEEIRSDQIKIDTGDLQPRHLSAKYREQKGLAPFKVGDEVVVTLNAQNQVVDAHLAGEAYRHKILRGRLAQPLTTGQEKAVIKIAGSSEESHMITPLARAKVASVPVGVEALFLIDEAAHIADVTYVNQAAARKATAAAQDRSPLKNAFARTPGVLSSALQDGSISITTERGGEETYKVRPLVESHFKGLAKGSAVILMIDDERMVTDVAVPAGSAQ